MLCLVASMALVGFVFWTAGVLTRPLLSLVFAAAEKADDLRLLEAGLPGGTGGGAPVLVPKAIDADEGDDDEDINDSDDSDSDEEVSAYSSSYYQLRAACLHYI